MTKCCMTQRRGREVIMVIDSGVGRGGGPRLPPDRRPFNCLYEWYIASTKAELIYLRTGLHKCEIDSLVDIL
jgi:hypothetical protein